MPFSVFVADPARTIQPGDVLRRLYGLTGAEAALATLLVNGRSPEDAAAELGVSIHTVRTQLKHVLGKTGARRQAELGTEGFEQVLADLRARDARDATRDVAPMIAATDALLLDTTDLSIDAAVAEAVAYVDSRIRAGGA